MDFLKDNIWFILISLNYAVAFVTAFFVLLKNRNPSRTLSYFLILIILPFVGVLVYYFFGQEYRKEKLYNKKKVQNNRVIEKWEKRLLVPDDGIDRSNNEILTHFSQLIKLVQNDDKKPLTFRNKAQLLFNGNNKFEALFESCKAAKNFIHLEYYIFHDDDIGSQLIDILCDKAKEGVQIKVSYDYVGSQLAKKAVERLKSCGVEIYPFMPVRFPSLTRKLNYRNHRKIAIIDGHTGFVGGVNISDAYCNGEHNEIYWRDMHLKLEGHAVKSLQSQFLLNWSFVSDNEDIDIQEEYFPKFIVESELPVQIVASGPDSDHAHIMQALFVGINSAKESIRITTPYFIPNDDILTALKTASQSGIDVELLIPKDGDSWAAKYASFSYVEELLESGIQVYCYCKGMIHAKTMVIDGQVTFIGTSNMDYRSFNINFEINAIIYDAKVGDEMTKIFNADLEETETLDLESWRERSLVHKLKESFNRLWAPLL